MKTIFISAASWGDVPHPNMAAIWLARRGHDLTFVGPAQEHDSRLSTPLGNVAADALDAGRGRMHLHPGLLLKVLKQRRAACGRALFFVQSAPACPAAWLALTGVSSRRIVYQTQDFLEPGRYPLWEFFERRLASRAGAVICNEPNRARFMASHYRLNHVPQVVRTALPRDWPIPERSLLTRRAMLAQCGRADVPEALIVHAGGGFSTLRCSRQLYQAFGRLPDRYLLAVTQMTGDTAEARLGKSLIQEAGIAARTIVLERLPYSELLATFAASDVGILLYPNDGIGNFYQQPGRLSEYVACGLPVVASNFPGLAAQVSHHRLGAVADPVLPDEIAQAILTLGERSLPEREADRERLRVLAKNELAYESDGWKLEALLTEAAG